MMQKQSFRTMSMIQIKESCDLLQANITKCTVHRKTVRGIKLEVFRNLYTSYTDDT